MYDPEELIQEFKTCTPLEKQPSNAERQTVP